MEIAYMMAGKQFKAKDVTDLNNQLALYNLICNIDCFGECNYSVRRITEPQGTERYDIVQSKGNSQDVLGFNVIIGKIIGTNGYDEPDIIEKELSDIAPALKEVKEDIPDAKIVSGSYWD